MARYCGEAWWRAEAFLSLLATEEAPIISSLQQEPWAVWARIQTSSPHLNSALLLFCQGHSNVHPKERWQQCPLSPVEPGWYEWGEMGPGWHVF